MPTEAELIAERVRKLAEWREQGENPYPYSFQRSHTCKEVIGEFQNTPPHTRTGKTVALSGRVVGLRRMGKATFGHIQDATGKMQLYCNSEIMGIKYPNLKLVDIGDFIGITGEVFTTKTGEVTLDVKELRMLCKAIRPLPDKWGGLKDIELRYRKRYLDLIINPEVRQTFEVRAKILKAIRSFLDDRGFTEVQTPILQPVYGGANARPFVSKINAYNMPVYLRIAYELYLKRLLVGGFEKIYDLSFCFRNEDADRTHNPEFNMMEIQWAYHDYNDVIKLTEELYEHVAMTVLGTTKFNVGEHTIDVKAPWKRLTMKQALKELADIDADALSDDELKHLLEVYAVKMDGEFTRGFAVMHLFEELCESKIIQPTHVTDHPKASCPLAKVHRESPELIERVEPFINGWEIGNGYSELNDPVLQRILFEEQVARGRGGDLEAHPMDVDYVEALEYGLPPNAGLGLSIDRMTMLMTNNASIRDVLLFPFMKPKDDKHEHTEP